MKTAFQYIRISKEEQSNFSVSGQQLINKEWAARHNINIIDTFIDDGYSAKDFNRPAWKNLDAVLTKNRVDYLIVWKYDRLIRNALESLIFVERLEKKLGITLISTMENSTMDPTDPLFFKQRAELFVDAEYERRKISDRTKMGLWSGRSQGRYLTKAPYGYLNKRDQGNMPILIVNPDQEKIIQNMYEDFLNDFSFVTILNRAKEKGFKLTGKEVVQRILSNQVYAGLIKVRQYKSDPEKIVKGMHAPIIDENTYWKVHYKLKEALKPNGPKIIDANIPLRGFLLCENCGNPHTGAKCKGKLQYYYYYWCNSCRGKNYSAIKVHQDLKLILNGLSLDDTMLNALKIETQKELDVDVKDQKTRMYQVKREYDDLQKNLRSLEEKYIQDKISQDTYNKWYSTYTTDLNKMNILLSDLQTNTSAISQQYIPYLEYLSDLNFIYEKADPTEKIWFLRALFPGCLIASKGFYRTPMILDEFLMNVSKIGHLLEVTKTGETSFLRNPPLGVAGGSQIEHLLKVVSQLLKAA